MDIGIFIASYCEGIAVCESVFVNKFYAVGQEQFSQTFTACKSHCAYAADCRGNVDNFQTSAKLESNVLNFEYSVGDFEHCEFFAVVESTLFYKPY